MKKSEGKSWKTFISSPKSEEGEKKELRRLNNFVLELQKFLVVEREGRRGICSDENELIV